MALITNEDIIGYIPDDDVPALEVDFEKLELRVEDAIYSYLGLPEGFFEAVTLNAQSQPITTEKEIYGVNGLGFLVLPPNVGDVAIVKDPNGVVLNPSTYKVVENRIYINAYNYDATSLPYKVTAAWGWARVPGDIQEAALQLVVRWWRGKEEGFSGVLGNTHRDGTIIERDFPPTVKTILNVWKDRLRKKFWLIDGETILPTTIVTRTNSARTTSIKNRIVW